MSKEVTIIPQGPSRKLPCRADTGPVTSRPAGVETYETLETVKKESVPRIEIEVHDSSQHDIILPGRTQLGRLRLVKSVKPMKIKLAKLDIDSNIKPERTTIGHIVAEVKKGGELQVGHFFISAIPISRSSLKLCALSFQSYEDHSMIF